MTRASEPRQRRKRVDAGGGRRPLLAQLEWIISHLDTPELELPVAARSASYRELLPRLRLYREDAAARKDLFKQYHGELAKAEVAQAKREDAKKQVDAMGVERARLAIDAFLAKWDGTDPMAYGPAGGSGGGSGGGLPATVTSGEQKEGGG